MDTVIYIAGFIGSGLCGCCAGALAVVLLLLTLANGADNKRNPFTPGN